MYRGFSLPVVQWAKRRKKTVPRARDITDSSWCLSLANKSNMFRLFRVKIKHINVWNVNRYNSCLKCARVNIKYVAHDKAKVPGTPHLWLMVYSFYMVFTRLNIWPWLTESTVLLWNFHFSQTAQSLSHLNIKHSFIRCKVSILEQELLSWTAASLWCKILFIVVSAPSGSSSWQPYVPWWFLTSKTSLFSAEGDSLSLLLAKGVGKVATSLNNLYLPIIV